MRKMSCSGNTECRTSLSCWADCEVAAERLLDDHPCVLRAARRAEPLDDGLEQARRDREVVRRARRSRSSAFLQLLERRRRRCSRRRRSAAALGELLERGLVVDAAAVLVDAVAARVREVVDRPLRRRDADHRDVERRPASPWRRARGRSSCARGRPTCRRTRARRTDRRGVPLLRLADRLVELLVVAAELLAHRRQELVGEVGVAARGEPRRTAPRSARRRARLRRSPRGSSSDPRRSRTPGPRSRARSGICDSECAVRSSSHDAMTLPRRHTSATAGRSRSYW